jgi:arylsulfatase A-like enzyme
MRRAATLLLAVLALEGTRAEPAPPAPAARFPNVVLVTVDTLRADHVSAYGYARPTTPRIDALLARGVRFAEARTVEPLTTPALASLLTSRYPHEHGATRNGLRLRAGLPSLAQALGQRGFQTAAFVGNWTLRDDLSGLGEHFGTYRQIASRKRWLVLKSEATGDDLTRAALDWLEAARRDSGRPFLLWVHYVEPHAPYRTQRELLAPLGLGGRRDLSPADRYDTEVAFADRAIGELLAGVRRVAGGEETLVAFAGDHGESLGEHGYWGHGRHLYENCLHVPMGIVWEGRLAPAVVRAQASLLDLAPTVLGLVGYPVLRDPRGFDWAPVLRGLAPPPHRPFYFQAHKGAVQSVEDVRRARRRGLLEVAILVGERKEVLRLRGAERLLVDVLRDPGDRRSHVPARAPPSAALRRWELLVEQGLVTADELPPPTLDRETEEQLRALGYIE